MQIVVILSGMYRLSGIEGINLYNSSGGDYEL